MHVCRESKGLMNTLQSQGRPNKTRLRVATRLRFYLKPNVYGWTARGEPGHSATMREVLGTFQDSVATCSLVFFLSIRVK